MRVLTTPGVNPDRSGFSGTFAVLTGEIHHRGTENTEKSGLLSGCRAARACLWSEFREGISGMEVWGKDFSGKKSRSGVWPPDTATLNLL
jgi:hypothetical protein